MPMNKGLSRRIRDVAKEKYVLPALRAGLPAFSLRVRDLMEDLRKEGISPEQNTPQFCSAIKKAEFLTENGLEIIGIEGPPSKQSTTVVVNYRVLPRSGDTRGTVPHPATELDLSRASTPGEALKAILERKQAEAEARIAPPATETVSERAFRLTEKLRGLMKDEIAAHGGTEGFMRWVRSDEDEYAA
jgi:hypothetical protein